MAPVLAIAACAALVLALIPLLDGVPLLGFTADDAYISFRYSEHLADGIGPVWNATGPRTDGYTSPLWMAVIALARVLGAGPEAASKAISLAAVLGALSVLAFAGGRRAPWVRVVAMAFLALSPAFVAITVQGFETATAGFLAMCTALLLLAALRTPGRREVLGLAVVGLLATFARPDLLPFVLCCFAGLGVWLLRERDLRAVRRPALWVAAGFGVPAVVWAAWRWSYYGYPLPNTSYVKRSPGLVNDESLRLIEEFLTRVAGPAVLGLAVLLTRAFDRREERRDPRLTWGVCTVLVGAAGFLAVGLKFEPIQGDLWRFQMPILPALLLCVVLLASRDDGAHSLGLRGGRWARAAALGVALLLVAFPLTTLREVRAQLRGRPVYDRKQAGLALAPFRRNGLTMFVSESGVLPWASDWRAYDLIGLNDHDIAVHGATLPRVLARRPDLIQFVVGTEPSDRFAGFYHPFSDLVRSGRFEFAAAIVKTNRELRPGSPAQAHLYFVRRDAPRARAIVATLRGLRHVRRLAPEITTRALRGFGYPG